MKKFNLFLATSLLVSSLCVSQTKEEKAEIIKNNNQESLYKLISELDQKNTIDLEKALEYSKANNVPMIVENPKDGSFQQLMRIAENGSPVYYTLHNVDAATSTRANRLHSGGSLGLNVEGQDMTAYVWDGGAVLTTHNEFNDQPVRRAQIGDNVTVLNANSFHATHVSGTIAASGVNAAARGMAPQADVITYDWSNDFTEMAIAASNGALLSNHSYGVRANAIDDQLFGKYITDSRNLDQIAFDAPYYLPVFSAGNDGGDNTSNGLPLEGIANLDKLSFNSVAKNVMVVANAQDAVINADGSLSSVFINTSSSQGPTDDLRVKPDITGNGTQLLSTYDGSNSDYNSISGTSMSAPNVTGSMLLLQQHYKDLNGGFMRAATLKGLTLHTADDVGIEGPDPIWGWGMMNTMEAANVISGNKLRANIIEEELQQGQTYTFTVKSDDISTLMASISWTDVAGNVNLEGANDATPALINDLDVRISQNDIVFEPWKLTGANSNSTGDNVVDNVERVEVPNATGEYVITVTHKGSLVGGSQKFSLIVTGLNNVYALSSVNPIVEVCNDQITSFPIDFLADPSFDETATLSLENLPSGINASFSNSSFTSNGSLSLDLSNLEAAQVGTYDLTVNAVTPTRSRSIDLTLRIMSDAFSTVNLVFPADQASTIDTSAILEWDDELNAQQYQIQISTSPTFRRTILDRVVDQSTLRVDPSVLFPSVTYYWRVMPINDCGQGTFVTRSFTTFDCEQINASVPAPIAIPDDNEAGITSVLNINRANNVNIGKVSVFIRSTHEYSGDLLIALTSPAGTSVLLALPSACELDDLLVTFDDNGGPFTCDSSTGLSGYTGIIQPVGNLSDFNGESINGDWTLSVADRGPADLGSLNAWSITFCEEPQTLSNDSIEELDFTVYPNPSNGVFTVSTANNTNSGDALITISDLNGRRVLTRDVKNLGGNLNETIDVQNLTNGLYLLQVQQGTSSTVEKIIINK
ncbi:S8 family serine peptidase [uncultured Nonlabens sp.]|uniref:S8 family serine peptidase n=1 Tax=uncultured Nonlabens sp. TaxID=859306 RepID=UPI0026280294|nr:S8 family serine peptidase [uncultured Nonlabens sp.]